VRSACIITMLDVVLTSEQSKIARETRCGAAPASLLVKVTSSESAMLRSTLYLYSTPYFIPHCGIGAMRIPGPRSQVRVTDTYPFFQMSFYTCILSMEHAFGPLSLRGFDSYL
jgi:hypothetical protein